MKTKKRALLVIIFVSIFLLPSISADIVSINSGGSNQTAITPNKYIEGFFIGASKSQTDKGSETSPGGGGGGSGGSPPEEENETNETFQLNKNKISVSAQPGKSVDGCFKAKNPTEDAIFGIKANLKGEVTEYAEIGTTNFNLMPGLSEKICLTFSSSEDKEPSKHTGTINVSENETKTISVSFKITEEDSEEEPSGGGGGSINETNETEEETEDISDLEGIKNLILWIPLIIIIIIFLIIKKYVRFTSEISSKKTREEKVAEAERIRRANQRKERNFFEKAIDRAAIILAEGTIGPKKKKPKKDHPPREFPRQ